MWTLLAAFPAALAALAQGMSPPPSKPVQDAAPLRVPPGYQLVWSDEFQGSGLPNPRKWAFDTQLNKRGWANKEKQYYPAGRLRNSRVRDGRLVIEAHVEALKNLPDWGGQQYSSARLVTRGKASWTYGYFEVRAKLPCGVGTWPAIWTLADKPQMKWPDDGEIDIMEHVGWDEGVVHQTIHTKAFNHVLHTQKAAQVRFTDICDAFHVYQLHWTPERLRMGIDGKSAFVFEASRDKAEWPFDGPQYLILNIAVGGTWGGEKGIDPKALPARMEVDYVRVFQPAKAGAGRAVRRKAK